MLDPDVRHVLDGTSIAHLATALPDGSPHTAPLWIGAGFGGSPSANSPVSTHWLMGALGPSDTVNHGLRRRRDTADHHRLPPTVAHRCSSQASRFLTPHKVSSIAGVTMNTSPIGAGESAGTVPLARAGYPQLALLLPTATWSFSLSPSLPPLAASTNGPTSGQRRLRPKQLWSA
jgi:hypothetical protein